MNLSQVPDHEVKIWIARQMAIAGVKPVPIKSALMPRGAHWHKKREIAIELEKVKILRLR